MRAPKRPAASLRENVFAQLGEAIDEATKLAWRLSFAERGSADARQLFTRLRALRAELDTLRLNGRATALPNIAPIWSKLNRFG